MSKTNNETNKIKLDIDVAHSPTKEETTQEAIANSAEGSSESVTSDTETELKIESLDLQFASLLNYSSGGIKDELPKLYGSKKKRFIWLTSQGYERDEALRLTNDPAKVNELRQQIKNKSTTVTKNESITDKEKTKSNVLVLAIAPSDYPKTTITRVQADEIKSAILKKVLEQKVSDLKPNFEECVFVNDYVRLICSDTNTYHWIQRILGKLDLWEGASFKIMSEKKLLKLSIYFGSYTDSCNDSNDDILNFIQSQNHGINTSGWNIISRKEVQSKKAVDLTFMLDPDSIKHLEKIKYLVRYKFGSVQIYKKVNPGGHYVIPGQTKPNQGSQNPRYSNRRNDEVWKRKNPQMDFNDFLRRFM